MSYCFCFHQGNRLLLFFIKVQYWDRGCSTANGVLFLGIIINIFCTLVITDIKWNVQEYILSGQHVSAYQLNTRMYTVHKIKFSVNTFFNKYEQIRNFPWIFTHLLNKFLTRVFFVQWYQLEIPIFQSFSRYSSFELVAASKPFLKISNAEISKFHMFMQRRIQNAVKDPS